MTLLVRMFFSNLIPRHIRNVLFKQRHARDLRYCYVDCASFGRRVPRYVRSLCIRRKWKRGREAKARLPVPHFSPAFLLTFPFPVYTRFAG